MADGGPVSIPPNNSVSIAPDGSISVVPLGQGPETSATVGRIKLVKPPVDQVERGEDGLFHMRDGTDAPSDASVHIASGVLESSNVNAAQAMVNMIELARNFDLQVKAIHSAEENAASSSQLLRAT
jgi:flagellar basal-body rod protein FlgF